MDHDALGEIHLGLGAWIRDIFGLAQGNDKLLKDIEGRLGRPIQATEEASAAILEDLARRLRRSHRLRVVK
jgi:hypothetical protein